jgi:hypothetical protein
MKCAGLEHMKSDPRYKVTRVFKGKKAQNLYVKFFEDKRTAWKKFPCPTFVYYSYRGKKMVSYTSGYAGKKTGLSRQKLV